MHGFFSYDGFVVQTCNKIADCICLSFLWLISSIPLITVGASTTSLYYAANKCICHSEGHLWNEFWKSFRSNFRQSTAIWLILFLSCALLFSSCYCAYLLYAAGSLPIEMTVFLLIVIAAVMMWAGYLFPYLARFTDSVKRTFQNCGLIAIMNFWTSLMQLVLILAALAAVILFPLCILIVPAGYMVISCRILEPVFKKYIPTEDPAKESAKHDT